MELRQLNAPASLGEALHTGDAVFIFAAVALRRVWRGRRRNERMGGLGVGLHQIALNKAPKPPKLVQHRRKDSWGASIIANKSDNLPFYSF